MHGERSAQQRVDFIGDAKVDELPGVHVQRDVGRVQDEQPDALGEAIVRQYFGALRAGRDAT